ncbi:hypothetical protein SKAU_G00048920 [Synaphobranchus kaupii]|uniref:Uncharacterized protein n=1 Tax=Synaphobranchus kaupii TaxID=118154 RepID=A0A9Q1J9K5_SYNKA|nr:hypothetical protein SKAU_G00048920 [Synaphobranchus kaupii]
MSRERVHFSSQLQARRGGCVCLGHCVLPQTLLLAPHRRVKAKSWRGGWGSSPGQGDVFPFWELQAGEINEITATTPSLAVPHIIEGPCAKLEQVHVQVRNHQGPPATRLCEC